MHKLAKKLRRQLRVSNRLRKMSAKGHRGAQRQLEEFSKQVIVTLSEIDGEVNSGNDDESLMASIVSHGHLRNDDATV